MLGGKSEPPPFLFLARRPFVTGDIIESVGLLYLKQTRKQNYIQKFMKQNHFKQDQNK